MSEIRPQLESNLNTTLRTADERHNSGNERAREHIDEQERNQ